MPFQDLNDDVLRNIAFFLEPFAPDTWRYHLNSNSAMRDAASLAPWSTPLPSPPLSPTQGCHTPLCPNERAVEPPLTLPAVIKLRQKQQRPENKHVVSSSIYPECPAPHWRSLSLPVYKWHDIQQFRETCTAVYRAVPHPLGYLDLGEQDMKRWLHNASLPEVRVLLERIKRVRLRGTQHVNHASAEASFATFFELIQHLPALEILELDNTFCAHRNYGFGEEDEAENTIQPVAPGEVALPRVRVLSTNMECRVCCVAVPYVLNQHLRTSVERLRLAAPIAPLPSPFLLRTLGGPGSALTTLVLKLPETWSPTLVLECLAGCIGLREIFVSFYDLSRKVEVMKHLSTDRTLPKADAAAAFFAALAKFPELETLDMCMSIEAFLSEKPNLRDTKRQRIVEASHVLAAHGIQRGWWWTRIMDLDYGQLMGYERLAWEARGPRVQAAREPAWLHPMVVRNADGQGTRQPMPDELWG